MKHKIDANYIQDIFVKYAKIETTSFENSDKVPSSEGQLVLGKIITEDLKAMGITEVEQNMNGYVMARIKGNVKAPTVAFIAHLDTYHSTNGKGVTPIVHKNYDGKDIKLPNDGTVITLHDFPELKEKTGKTIITSSGDTLLGGDDKAGIAICMETAKFLMENKDFKHGDVAFVFTPDEEVYHGAKLLDIKKLDAVCAYTLDGDSVGNVTNENFCANSMTVTCTGRDIHPGYAKNKMISAIRLASEFVEKLPMNARPETTEKKESFIHPIKIDGGVTETKITCIVRSFTEEGLKEMEHAAQKVADEMNKEHKGANIKLEIKEQYRNMKYALDKDPRAVDYACKAMEACGIKCKLSQIRGGSDGAGLSFRGLLTPDISAGFYAFHSKAEWVCLEEMAQTADVLKELISLWAK